MPVPRRHWVRRSRSCPQSWMATPSPACPIGEEGGAAEEDPTDRRAPGRRRPPAAQDPANTARKRKPLAANKLIHRDGKRQHGGDDAQPGDDGADPRAGRKCSMGSVRPALATAWSNPGRPAMWSAWVCEKQIAARPRKPHPEARQAICAPSPQSKRMMAPSERTSRLESHRRGSGSIPPVPSRTASITLVATRPPCGKDSGDCPHPPFRLFSSSAFFHGYVLP